MKIAIGSSIFALVGIVMGRYDALAFEVDGFRDGMTKVEARTLAQRTLNPIVWNDETQTFGGVKPGTAASVVLTFCDDKLVQVSRVLDSDANLPNAVTLLDEQLRLRGQPTRVSAGSRLLANAIGGGQMRDLNFTWRSGRETYELGISAHVGGSAASRGGNLSQFGDQFSVESRCTEGRR